MTRPTTAGSGTGRVLPAAVLFDMDGLLVDSEPLWAASAGDVLRPAGLHWTEADDVATLGGSMEATARYVLGRLGVTGDTADLRWPDVVDDLVHGVSQRLAGEVRLLPGARRLLDELRAAGTSTALVSNSDRRLVDAVVGSLGTDRFSVTVAADDVRRGKPDPEPYLTAAARLGVDPRDCAVLEDSITGSTAGLAAGATVVGVPTAGPDGFDPRVHLRSSLLEVDLAVLSALCAGGHLEGARADPHP